MAAITGLRTTSARSIAKSKWMVEHGAPRKARWRGGPESLALCLTGRWLAQRTLAVRTGEFNVLQGEYSRQLLRLADAPIDLFAPVHGSPERAGPILPEISAALGLVSSVQVVLAGHDDIVSAYGAGGKPRDPVDSAGTVGGVVRIINRRRDLAMPSRQEWP